MTQILFATIAAGGGHVATANAMAEELQRQQPGAVRTPVVDVMAEWGHEELDRRHKESWRRMLKRPQLVRLGQRVTDLAPGLTRAAQNVLLDGFARSAQQRIDDLAPDLVVANHGWLATALTLAATRYRMRTPVLIFATEPFDASALWAEPRAERVVAPSLAAKEDLVRLGVPAAKITVLGYPVRRAFLNPPEQSAVRSALQLDDAFTCLLSLGAEGLAGEALQLAEALASLDAQVVAVAGRNAELAAGFERLAQKYERFRAVGFTHQMPAYLAASDLVVGKAGPASTMEALAVGRPVLATTYAGLNEECVVRFLQLRQLGGYAPTRASLERYVSQWRDPERLREAATRARTLDFPGMSQRVADYIWKVARGDPAPGPYSTPMAQTSFEATTSRSLAGVLARTR